MGFRPVTKVNIGDRLSTGTVLAIEADSNMRTLTITTKAGSERLPICNAAGDGITQVFIIPTTREEAS